MIKKYRTFLFRLTLILAFLIFSLFLYKAYAKRVNAFGCFDDCFNFSAGYFLNQGKTLYSQVFFNHQPGMAYLSAVIQKLTQPINIYDLVLRHRQSLFLFAAIADILLILRFGLAGFLFAVIYESSKFYIFGDRFLAESLIVYPFVYLAALTINKLSGNKLLRGELIFSAILTWLIFVMREPYIPGALFIFAVLLWNKNFLKEKVAALLFFLTLVILSTPIFSLKDYLFDVFMINTKSIAGQEFSNEKFLPFGFLKVFFYPVYIFLNGEKSLFKTILVLSSSLFLYANLIYYFLKKNLKTLIFILLVLGLVNLRIVEPGKMFYASFHLLPYYALFLSASFFLLQNLNLKNKIIFFLPALITIYLFLNLLFAKNSFLKEKIDPHLEFITNYGGLNQTGEGIKALANKNNTLFADGFAEEIYWEANLASSFKYSIYTSLMPLFKKFSESRLEMFKNNPPDFYYGSCPQNKNPTQLLPIEVRLLYIQLKEFGKPSCLFLHKNLLGNISIQQWTKAQSLGWEKPE